MQNGLVVAMLRDVRGLLARGLTDIWEFPKIRVTLFGGLVVRILLFRVLC